MLDEDFRKHEGDQWFEYLSTPKYDEWVLVYLLIILFGVLVLGG